MTTIDKNFRVNPESLSSSLQALSERKPKTRFLPRSTPKCPVEIARAQVPIITTNLATSELTTVGRFQEAVGRLKVLDRYDETIASGSAVAINRKGLFVTAKHVISNNDPFKYLFSMLAGKSDYRFEIEICKLDPEEPNHYKLESYPATVLDYDTSLDIGLIRIDQSEKSSFISFKLDEKTPKVNSSSFKIGHIDGKSYNCFSNGLITNPSLDPEIVGEIILPLDTIPEPGYIVSNNAVFHGDSGGALIGESGKVVGIVIQMREPGETSEELLARDYKVKKDYTNSFTAISASTAKSVLPYLDRVVGSNQFKKIIDGEDVVINKDEINRSATTPFPGVVIFIIS